MKGVYPAMKRRRKKASENALTISRRYTRSPTSVENSETIPVDLIIEVLLRLPAKSIGRCRCVSKLWSCTLVGPYFTELFLTRSFARPRLLFSFQGSYGDDLLFFSAPQVRNPVENSCIVLANHHMKFPFDYQSKTRGPVRGLVCITYPQKLDGRKKTEPLICNPSTGQSLRIPIPNLKTKSVVVNSLLGFDPVGKQYKLLSMTSKAVFRGEWVSFEEHKVLTLGTQKLSWRMVKCCISHYNLETNDGVCINGRLYYVALLNDPPRTSVMIWFDVRSEKFGFVNKAKDMVLWRHSTLVDYNGKLAALFSGECDLVTRDTTCLELWVLVDAEKHEWSKHISVLPPLWKDVVAEAQLYFVGLIGTDEIVLSPRYLLDDPFYVFYYSIKRNTITRVEIQGIEAFGIAEFTSL